MTLDDLLQISYVGAVIAVPFLAGLAAGRASKPNGNPYLETIGRTVDNAVACIRSDARFTGDGCVHRTTFSMTIRNDATPYLMTIERRAAA